MSPSELGLMINIDLVSEFKTLNPESFRGPICLPPAAQALSQKRRQASLDDLLLRGLQIVFHSAIFDDVFFDVIDAISGAPISIARLADTAGVDEILFGHVNLKLFNPLAAHPFFFSN